MHHTSQAVALVSVLALAGCAVSTSEVALTAMDFPAERVEEAHAKAELLFESDSVAPGGDVWIGVRFKVEDGWHLYWNGRNETGSPPTFSVELPPGYSLGDWSWPAPKRHVAPGDILDHIYEGTVLIMAPLSVPKGAKESAPITVKVAADWVVCDSNMCVAESSSLVGSLPIKTVATNVKDPAFAATRVLHPKAWPTDSSDFSASVERSKGKALAKFRVAGATSIEFYPGPECPDVEELMRKGATKGDSMTILFAAGAVKPLVGVIAIGRNGQRVSEFYTVSLSPPTAVK
jgi:DsbC/DsbD-like thiol-disulfide interchange protein